MVNRYKGKVQGWELWNEPDIEYWQPHVNTNEELVAKGKQYGAELCRFARGKFARVRLLIGRQGWVFWPQRIA